MAHRSKRILILVIRYPGLFPTALACRCNYRYTHAAIGLEEDLNIFYSFRKSGFTVEQVTRYLKPGREPFPCALYEITVSHKIYRRVKKLIAAYAARKKFLGYTHLTLVACFFGIRLHIPNRYICSQFVAEVLQRANAARLPKHSALCLPRDFHEMKETRMIFSGDLQSLADHYQLPPYFV